MVFYIVPANDDPGIQNDPTSGDIPIYLQCDKTFTSKILLLRNHESQSFLIFVCGNVR